MAPAFRPLIIRMRSFIMPAKRYQSAERNSPKFVELHRPITENFIADTIMKTPSVHSRFASFAILLCAEMLLSASATFAADETCASCSQQVSVAGSFSHRKDNPSVVIDGAGNNAAAYREDVNGTNFTVTIAGLPAGKYTLTIGAA